MTSSSMNNKDDLGFASSVHAIVGPILSKYDFAIKYESPLAVGFQSTNVDLSVFRRPYSYEIDIDVCHMSHREHFSLQDIIDSQDGIGGVLLQASSPARVVQCLTSMAVLLATYGQNILKGDLAAFQHMSLYVKTRDENVTREIVTRPIRDAAESAWKRKDYCKVLELYKSIIQELTAIEERRLEYARRHLSRKTK